MSKHAALSEPYPYLTIHGLLHLASFEHENDDEHLEMIQLERKILATIGIKHPEDY